MEILVENIAPENKPWIGQCNHCASIMTAVRAELPSINPGDYRSDNEAWVWATCPVCKKRKSVCFHEANTESGKRVLALVPE